MTLPHSASMSFKTSQVYIYTGLQGHPTLELGRHPYHTIGCGGKPASVRLFAEYNSTRSISAKPAFLWNPRLRHMLKADVQATHGVSSIVA